jgi:hypothetical protein
MHENLKNAVQEVVADLVDGKYQELERRTGGVRLTSVEMEEAVRGYGRTLIHLPAGALECVDVIRIDRLSRPSWSLVVPLWTREEGRSDLSLELTLREGNDGLAVEIDDIHVL